MVRTPERAGTLAKLPGAQLVRADFDDMKTLGRALEGVDRAFLLTSSTEHAEQQQRAFVDTARLAGVRHIVKLSQWAATRAPPFVSSVTTR